MKKYTFQVTIHEENDEFWESLDDRSGTDDVTAMVKTALAACGHSTAEIRLIRYEDDIQ
jgi:hypothetical protein